MKTRRSPDRELRDAIAFALLKGVGSIGFRLGVERHGSAAAAFHAHKLVEDKNEALTKASATIAKAREIGVTLLLQGEPGFPAA